jgi:hypothetical protein
VVVPRPEYRRHRGTAANDRASRISEPTHHHAIRAGAVQPG